MFWDDENHKTRLAVRYLSTYYYCYSGKSPVTWTVRKKVNVFFFYGQTNLTIEYVYTTKPVDFAITVRYSYSIRKYSIVVYDETEIEDRFIICIWDAYNQKNNKNSYTLYINVRMYTSRIRRCWLREKRSGRVLWGILNYAARSPTTLITFSSDQNLFQWIIHLIVGARHPFTLLLQ